MNMIRVLFAVAAVFLCCNANSTLVGGVNFQDGASADELGLYLGSFHTSGGGGRVIVDDDPSSFIWSRPSGAKPLTPYMELLFTDNYIVNAEGPDLAIFGVGNFTPYQLALEFILNPYPGYGRGIVPKLFNPIPTGKTVYSDVILGGESDLYVALIDLDDFGIAKNGRLQSIILGFTRSADDGNVLADTSAYSLVVALNSESILSPTIPTPAPLTLIGLGLACLGWSRCKKV